MPGSRDWGAPSSCISSWTTPENWEGWMGEGGCWVVALVSMQQTFSIDPFSEARRDAVEDGGLTQSSLANMLWSVHIHILVSRYVL